MKKIIAILLSVIMLLGSTVVYAGSVTLLPSQVPNSVYQKPYAPNQFVTVYTPWLKNLHLINDKMYNQGLYGGEGCQLVRCMDISPVNDKIMYFITDSSGVFATDDGGQHWYSVNNNIVSYYGCGLLCDRFDENTVYAYIYRDGAYKSTNRGRTWELILKDDADFRGFTSNKFAMDARKNLYIAGGSGIYIMPYGTSEPINLYSEYSTLTGENSARFSDIYVTDDGQTIYATGMNTSNGDGRYKPGLYISFDGGKTWENKSLFEDALTTGYSITVHPENDKHLFLSAAKYVESSKTVSERGLYESIDGGKTFTKKFVLSYENIEENVAKSDKSFYKLRFGPKNADGIYPLYMAGNEITFPLRRSLDMGKTFHTMHGRVGKDTWRAREGSEGETGWYYEAYAVNMNKPGVVYFVGDGIQKYDNGEISWCSSGFSGASVTYISMSQEGDMLLTLTDVGCVPGNGKYTKDSYPTFTVADDQILTLTVFDPKDSKHIIGFAGLENGANKVRGVCESFDGGYTFGNIIDGSIGEKNSFLLKYDAEDSNIIYTSEYTSYDNGKTWKKNKYFLIDVSDKNPNKMIALQGQDNEAEIYVSEDKGETWEFVMKPGGLTFVDAAFDTGDDNVIWYTNLYDFGKIDLEAKTKTSLNSKFSMKRFHYFAQNPKNPNHIVLTERPNFGDMSKTAWLYESTDGGETFHGVPGLTSVGYFQRLFFSTTTDEVFLGSHKGTFIYNYKEYWKFLESKITVLLNEGEVSFSVMPKIENGVAVVPMRELFEMFGATVIWDGSTESITAKRKNTNVTLKVGSDSATINGRQVKLDIAPYVEGDKTLVPLRFVSEALDINVGWDAEGKIIILKE